MVNKTYGVDGMTMVRWPLSNPTGDVKVMITFRNGCLDDKQKRPATFSTTDPVTQLIIENHRLFKIGRIRLIATSALAETVRTPELNEKTKKAAGKKSKTSDRTIVNSGIKDEATGMTAYPEAKTLGDVTNILLSLGVKMDELRDEDSILRAAGDMKLYFPNYEG